MTKPTQPPPQSGTSQPGAEKIRQQALDLINYLDRFIDREGAWDTFDLAVASVVKTLDEARREAFAKALAAGIVWGVEWGLKHSGMPRENWPMSWDAGFPGLKAQALLDAQSDESLHTDQGEWASTSVLNIERGGDPKAPQT